MSLSIGTEEFENPKFLKPGTHESLAPMSNRPLPYDWEAAGSWYVYWPSLFEVTYWLDELTDPQGTKPNPVASFNLDNGTSGWRERRHSDHLARDMDEVFRWYELLFNTDVIGPGESAILPKGTE